MHLVQKRARPKCSFVVATRLVLLDEIRSSFVKPTYFIHWKYDKKKTFNTSAESVDVFDVSVVEYDVFDATVV